MSAYTFFDDEPEERYPNPLNDERVDGWPDIENHMIDREPAW